MRILLSQLMLLLIVYSKLVSAQELPEGITFTAAVNKKVYLTWQQPQSATVSKIEYSTDQITWTNGIPTSASSGVVSGLENGLTYSFRIEFFKGPSSIGFSPVTKAQPDADCFSAADNENLTTQLFRIAGVPQVNGHLTTARSPSYPGNSYASKHILNQQADLPPQFYETWVNRCNYIPGVTPDDGKSCVNFDTAVTFNEPVQTITDKSGGVLYPFFSTYGSANECTRLQIKRILGASVREIVDLQHADHAQKTLKLWFDQSLGKGSLLSGSSGGLDGRLARIYGRTFKAGKNAPDRLGLIDVCVLQTVVPPNTQGVFLDYEVFDGRQPDDTVAFFASLQDIVHSYQKKLVLNTDALGPVNPVTKINKHYMTKHGFGWSNAHQILDLVDLYVPTISNGSSQVVVHTQLRRG